MSERLPSVPREELRLDRQQFHDHFRATTLKSAPHPGAADRATKTLFPILSVLPKTGRANVDMLALLEKESSPHVSRAAREVASLVATHFFKSGYVDFIHRKMAVEMKYLTEGQVDAIGEGRRPEGLSKECGVAYDLAWHLLEIRGSVSDDLWERCLRTFGVEGAVGLMHYVALISWTSLGLNLVDVPVPEPPSKGEETSASGT